jgi:5'-deoxynucleotidase YfbR-like HD superfamily hydrolase
METLKIFSVIHAAEAATRYSRDDCSIPENVLTHTGWVATWCLFCAKDLEAAGAVIDYGSLLQKAIVHDFDEIGTGDIPRVTKYARKDCLEAFKEIERVSVKGLDKFTGIKLYDLWDSAKDRSTEGLLVKFADIAAVVYKSWTEITRKNNYSFSRVSIEVEGMLDGILADVTQEMEANLKIWFYNRRREFVDILAEANEVCRERRTLSRLGFSIDDKAR